MTSPIISQGEIDALLHSSSSKSLSPDLLQAFDRTMQNTGLWLGKVAGYSGVEGPYVERLTQGLAQNLTSQTFVILADLGQAEILFFMSAMDANTLAEYWQSDPLGTFQQLSQAWIMELAEQLATPWQVFQAQIVGQEALERQSWPEPSYLVRHLIEFSGQNLELCFVVSGDRLEQVVSQAPKGQPAKQTSKLTKKHAGSKLLKGDKSPVAEASFSPLSLPTEEPQSYDINLLEDIDLSVTVELGRVVLTLNDVLELKPQTVITLNRNTGEPVDIYVNANPTAKGEVVVLEDNFGVRLLEIIPKSERIPKE